MTPIILVALVPVFFVLALGYLAGKASIVDGAQVNGLNALVMNFALPASILATTATAPRNETIAQVPLFFIISGVMVAMYFLWYFLQPHGSRVSRGEALHLTSSASFLRSTIGWNQRKSVQWFSPAQSLE